MSAYDDILHLPHHVSAVHPQMSLLNRAAQFHPFAALTGYDDAIDETGRVTDDFAELSEDRMLELNEKLMLLRGALHTHPVISVTYFQPDDRKSGGAYLSLTGQIRKIRDFEREIVIEDVTIPVDRIMELDGALFSEWDIAELERLDL